MRRVLILIAVVLVLGTGAVFGAVEPKEKVMLFNGKNFDGLFRFLRDSNADVDDTWTVKPGGILACTGKPAGYIRTKTAYKNYKVHFEYRWPGRTGNNGILVHVTGEDRVWPQSLECQGAYRNQGDFWEIGGFGFRGRLEFSHGHSPYRQRLA